MKTLINKKTDITKTTKDDNDEYVTENIGYIDLMFVGLNVIPDKGWTTDIMRKRIRVEDKLESIGLDEEFQLEDADFELIADLCAPGKIRWAMKHRDVIAFEDYIKELSEEN